jgi:hypothetical protein
MAAEPELLAPNPDDIAHQKPINGEHRVKLTKMRRKEICREIIDRCPIGAEFPPEDLALFNEMCGTSWLAAKHIHNTEWPNDPRHVHVFDGEKWKAFSAKKAISPPTDWTELCKVMREAVAEQARDFKSATSDQFCAWGHKGGCNGDLQADHAEAPFDDIAKAFVDANGIPEIEDGPPGAGKMFKCMDTEANWIGFHASRVVWQLLCRTHNASKGRKKPGDDGSEQ